MCIRDRQGIFPQTFKFFDVPRIFPTGVAKHSFSNLAVDVAKDVYKRQQLRNERLAKGQYTDAADDMLLKLY